MSARTSQTIKEWSDADNATASPSQVITENESAGGRTSRMSVQGSKPRSSSRKSRQSTSTTDAPAYDKDKLVDGQNEETTGCCGKSGEGFRSFWSTRELEMADGPRESFIKTTLIELFIYIIFLTLLSIVTFCMISPVVYYYTNMLSGLFTETKISETNEKTFRTIRTYSDFWEFLNGSLMENLYWETELDGRNLTDEELNYIFYENKLLGVPRLRQLKVRSDSCTVQDDFRKIIKSCYGPYGDVAEFKDAFGPERPEFSKFTYRTAEQLGGSSHWGIISTYGGGGYTQSLARNKTVSSEIINYMFTGQWIDQGTRAVFIDFTVYNANINLFCVIRLLAEFPATGGVITSSAFYAVKLKRYVSTMDTVIMVLECILCAFIFYYIVEEIMEMLAFGFKYWTRFWNYIDFAIIALAICCVTFNVYRTLKVNDILDDLLKDQNKYPDFEYLAFWQVVFNSALAVMVFFAWVKVFKYLSFNKTMTQLSSTLSRCAKDLAGFAVMFFIIFLAFAQLGYLIFGTQAKGFSTFADSIFTLFRIILGDFDFTALEEANRVLGPIFFILYVFFVFFVLLNMFLAIINDTYAKVKDNLDRQNIGYHVTDYIRLSWYRFLDRLSISHSAYDGRTQPKNCEDWRMDMITHGYAREHVDVIASKYCPPGAFLTSSDQEQLQKELEAMSRGFFYGPEMAGQAPGAIDGRLDNMQRNLLALADKVEETIIRFKKTEKQRVQRAAAMSNLLDAIMEAESSSDEKKRKQIQQMVRDELSRMT